MNRLSYDQISFFVSLSFLRCYSIAAQALQHSAERQNAGCILSLLVQDILLMPKSVELKFLLVIRQLLLPLDQHRSPLWAEVVAQAVEQWDSVWMRRVQFLRQTCFFLVQNYFQSVLVGQKAFSKDFFHQRFMLFLLLLLLSCVLASSLKHCKLHCKVPMNKEGKIKSKKRPGEAPIF